MKEYIKQLNSNIEYLEHEVIDGTYHITVKSTNDSIKCPICNKETSRIETKYNRVINDLPIGNKPVKLIFKNRVFVCPNAACSATTFSEKYDFVRPYSTNTKRLENHIINTSKTMSSIDAQNLLRSSGVKISKSKICTMLKKNN